MRKDQIAKTESVEENPEESKDINAKLNEEILKMFNQPITGKIEDKEMRRQWLDAHLDQSGRNDGRGHRVSGRCRHAHAQNNGYHHRKKQGDHLVLIGQSQQQ